MPITIRPAAKGDQPVIKEIVHTARINPMHLNWHRFLVAEDDGQIVGVGQVKPHRDGSREVASIAVIPSRQRQGIGSAIIWAILEKEPRPLYLICADSLEAYYMSLGFSLVGTEDMPPYFRRITRLVKVMMLFLPTVIRTKVRFIVMRLAPA